MSIVQGVMTMYLGTLSVVDARKKKLSIWLLSAGILIIAAGILAGGGLYWYERIAGAFIGLVMFLISKVTKEAVGKADCILIFYLGIFLGYSQCLRLLFFSFLICSVVCMVCLGFRVVTRKQRIAFVPFLFAGYLCSLIWLT